MLFLFQLRTHTRAHDHSPILEQHKHTQRRTSGELTVRMVPSPRDPGRGSQEVARCKLGECWVQRLSAHSLDALSPTPPPLLIKPPRPPPPLTLTPWDTGGQSGNAERCFAILGGCYFLQLFTFRPCFSQSAAEHAKGRKGRCEKGQGRGKRVGGKAKKKKVREGDGVDREQTGFSPRNVKSN